MSELVGAETVVDHQHIVALVGNQVSQTREEPSGSFNSGQTSKSFTFSATDDTVDDDGESVKLTFGALPSRVSQGTRNETTVNITDDDDPEVTVAFGAAAYTAHEGSSATVEVTLSGDPERTVAIPVVAANQGGATTADYSSLPASVTFDVSPGYRSCGLRTDQRRWRETPTPQVTASPGKSCDTVKALI